MKHKSHSCILISGPSGAGKGTIIKAILNRFPHFELCISATTRQKRTNEIDGKDYYFLDSADFDSRIANDLFLEHCAVHGKKYGTLKSELERIRNKNKTPIIEIDIQGAAKLTKKINIGISFFITSPTLKELKTRLIKRNTEKIETIIKRVNIAKAELLEIFNYDYIIVNNSIEKSLLEIKSVLI